MNPRFSITHAIANDLSRIDQAKGFLDAVKWSEESLSAMLTFPIWRPAYPDISRRTLQCDIQGLVAVGILKAKGGAISLRYMLNDNRL